ncbi:hypothetical protein [Zavarzinella formosa]|uniref:hypothetical protein n=1 Tax=Zavarzinella formosa TaxID=360055 RepID=UPI00036A3941|nr:hypothetical protein [Zavarzinella formosa]
MPMPPHEIICYAPGCGKPAVFKIAARWSDGVTRELKTYSLSCADCRDVLFDQAMAKKGTCRLTTGETLSEPEVFDLVRGRRDHDLMGGPKPNQPG